MKKKLSQLDRRVRGVVTAIGKEAEKNACRAYLVGGFVRDIVLKRKNFDVDIVIEGDVYRLLAGLSKKMKAPILAHKRFGTAVMRLDGGFRVDLATARKESYSHPGALPQVSSGNILNDLLRRDFTINTLAIEINPKRSGEMLDVAEGLKDIRRKKIRVLHERSFIDDPTRILRAVRFEQRLGFQIEPKSLSLLKTALRKKMVDYVKPPRYFEEFKKILKETDPAKHLKRLHSLGGLDFLSGRFLWTAATARFLAKIEKESGRFQENFPDKNFEPWIVNFAALISSLRPVDCEKICRRFQLSNTQRKTVLSSGKVTEVIKKLSLRNQPASEIYRLLRPLSYETMVFLKVKASGAVVQQRVNRFLKKHDHIALHIDGFDVQKAGVPKGSKIGVVLKNVLYAKIDGRVWTKRDELRLAKELSVSLS